MRIIKITIVIVIMIIIIKQSHKEYEILVIISALEKVFRSPESLPGKVSIKNDFTILLQKACLLGTARTLRYVLNS